MKPCFQLENIRCNFGDRRLSASKIWTALTFVKKTKNKNNFSMLSFTKQETKMFPEN